MSEKTLLAVFRENIPILEAPPKISLLIDERIKDIPKRFLPLGSKNEILSRSNKAECLKFLRQEESGFQVRVHLKEKLENGLEKLTQDIQEVFDAIVQKFGALDISEEELTPFQPDIIEIYKLLVHNHLGEVRSEINRQINQIVLIIMTRKSTESTKDSAGGILSNHINLT